MESETSQETHGIGREREVREIAARPGVADFVFAAPPVARGAALPEEAGDDLLVVGSCEAVLLVRAREARGWTARSPWARTRPPRPPRRARGSAARAVGRGSAEASAAILMRMR